MKHLLALIILFGSVSGCGTGLYQLAQGDCALPETKRPIACGTVYDGSTIDSDISTFLIDLPGLIP